MKKTILALLLASGVAHAAPAIDSSEWPVDPNTYGMTAEQYIQTESLAFFNNFYKRAGFNNFFHFQKLSTKDDKWVVSPNQDTLYSLATINAKDGFTLELPDVGDRFISIQVVNENHYTPEYKYGGGTYHFTRKEVGSDLVVVGIRIGTDGSPEDVKYISEKLHPQYKVIAPAGEGKMPELDLKKMMEVREALLPYYAKLPNTFGIMSTGYHKGQDDWLRAVAAAGAWGLSADENAMYAISGPKDAKANECYKATFPKVPVKAFFSLTAYNADKFLMTNEKNSLSSNRKSLQQNKDGGFTAYFGGADCKMAGSPNFIMTPEDGWDTLLRAYSPEVAAFKAYKVPTYEIIK